VSAIPTKHVSVYATECNTCSFNYWVVEAVVAIGFACGYTLLLHSFNKLVCAIHDSQLVKTMLSQAVTVRKVQCHD